LYETFLIIQIIQPDIIDKLGPSCKSPNIVVKF